VTKTLQVKLILWVHENETKDPVDLWLLRQQILSTQKAYDDDVSSANIAHTILDEVKGFNPFKLLKYSFWHWSPVLLFFSQMLHGVKTIHWIKGTGFIANI
jgi:hypothetical protein